MAIRHSSARSATRWAISRDGASTAKFAERNEAPARSGNNTDRQAAATRHRPRARTIRTSIHALRSPPGLLVPFRRRTGTLSKLDVPVAPIFLAVSHQTMSERLPWRTRQGRVVMVRRRRTVWRLFRDWLILVDPFYPILRQVGSGMWITESSFHLRVHRSESRVNDRADRRKRACESVL